MDGYVYFIATANDSAVKIGWASDVRKRCKELQTGCPAELYVAYAIPGTKSDETWARSHFDHLKIRGEWLKFHEEVHDFITDLERAQVTAALRDAGIHDSQAFRDAMDEASLSRCRQIFEGHPTP
jgi:T5orf172 domain-containing protein